MTWEYKVYRTVGEIARFLGYGVNKTKQLLSTGKLPAWKEDGVWVMTNKAYDEWVKKERG